MEFKRGNVYRINLPKVEGSVQSGERPCCIIQNNVGNIKSSTIIIVPMTSQKKPNMPTHHIINNKYDFLEKRSTVLCEQILTVSKENVMSYLGELDKEDMDLIKKSICCSIAV